MKNARTSYGRPNKSFAFQDQYRKEVPNTESAVNTVDVSKQKCFRCGATDHTWRRCHLPFRRVLAFGNRPNGEKGEKKVFALDNVAEPPSMKTDVHPVDSTPPWA